VPSDRTFVTELATALGTTGDDLEVVLWSLEPPPAYPSLTQGQWSKLRDLFSAGTLDGDFRAGFANGRAFLEAPDGLGGRRPRLVEWTGGRRPPGDEVVPADLRIDHVYLVSCKYLSRILHNVSPARLVDGLLSTAPLADPRDWFARVAPEEYQALYSACVEAGSEGSGTGLPMFAMTLTRDERRRLEALLASGWPPGVEPLYQRLCDVVATETAKAWQSRLGPDNAETMLWRLLRIGSAPYFILGTSQRGSMRLRIATPWDWRRHYRLLGFGVEPQAGGQPRVRWSAVYEVRGSGEERVVSGHVEVRWSHGRFSGPPEAKVYLDIPHEAVPGYHAL
jgi:hypothetical protein